MASSDQKPKAMPPGTGEGPVPLGRPTTVTSKILDVGAQMTQSMNPIRRFQQHCCSFAIYGHDLNRQIETHFFASRINQDVLQCAVYDSDSPDARLIGVEYIVSDRLFEALPEEEQRMWHSHAYEIKSGLWINPRVLEMIGKQDLKLMAKTYGKFWCTWQVDRGDRLPLGAPALMMSPQGVEMGKVRDDLVIGRNERYGVSGEELMEGRMEMEEPEWINLMLITGGNIGRGLLLMWWRLKSRRQVLNSSTTILSSVYTEKE